MFVREVTETSAILDWSTTALVPGGKPEVVKELPDKYFVYIRARSDLNGNSKVRA